ncbi:helix-turn-helix transcriptional regulator [Cohnella faecalis]|uniref:CBS domain-containing protein n=1 Tax=Cohnella faecalis TaxID=2315694 RepID=A0A398CEB6_9BACL|nr:helix-turn-helix transcriptional regulator [Cohnella faecalis]RIE00785.1 CBS domain-containing protein [Cohnella faecalis]
MELTPRQLEIIERVKGHAPITGEQIAESLGISRPTIRSDLSVLVMLGYIDAKPKVGYFLGKQLSTDGKVKEKLMRLKVKDVMGRPVVIPEQATVNDAVISLFVENTGILAVTDSDGGLAGLVSLKDLLKVTLGNPNAASIPISMVMTRLPRVMTVTPEDTVWEAAKKLLDHQIGGMPVVKSSGNGGTDRRSRLEVVGRISKTTMTQALVELTSDL